MHADSLNEFTYVGPRKDKQIHIYCRNEHFYTVKKMSTFCRSSYFCYDCIKPYSVYHKHPCNNVCKKCTDRKCKDREVAKYINCEFCNVRCRGEECYFMHKNKVCGNISKCEKCGSFKTNMHFCNAIWCSFCKEEVDNKHQCYILTEEERKSTKTSDKSVAGYKGWRQSIERFVE